MMSIIPLSETETAPFASGRSVLVPAVKLNILHGMSKSELVYTSASCGVTVNLNNWESVDHFLSICFVCLSGYLKTVWFELLVIEAILSDRETSERDCAHAQKSCSHAEHSFRSAK